MDQTKVPYAKRDFKASFAIVKEWKLFDGELGCTPLDAPGMCLAMDKAPPPLPGLQPPKPFAAPKPPTEGPTLVAAWRDVKEWAASAAAKPPPPPPSPPKAPVPIAAQSKPTIPPFDLYDIPTAMKAESFGRGAIFSKRWLNGRYYQAPITWDAGGKLLEGIYDSDMVDTDTVTLNWLLGYRSIKKDYDILLAEKVSNAPAKRSLKESAFAKFFSINATYTGNLNTLEYCDGDLQKLHRDFQFQVMPVSTQDTLSIANVLQGGLTDVTAALGNFAFYAAVARANIKADKYYKYNTPQGAQSCFRPQVELTHVYIYVKDSYHFFDAPGSNQSQYLGHWNKYGVSISANKKSISAGAKPTEENTYHYVDNAKYREWRTKHQRGGDFLIFSDLKLIKLETPILITMDEVCT